MDTILGMLEAWATERAPLVTLESRAMTTWSRLSAMGQIATLDDRMSTKLEARGIKRGGYTLPPATLLARTARPSVLPILAHWQAERAKLDAEEVALPTVEARRPIALTKSTLDNQVLTELEALGVPAWGLQAERAMELIYAVCSERGAAS
jgi:hypothetical protein